jgi:hypothetical protein
MDTNSKPDDGGNAAVAPTQFVVRFDRSESSTGPDAVSIVAERFSESYRDGLIVAYAFFDAEGTQVAMVRAAHVVYIARAGTAVEPAQPATGDVQTPGQRGVAGEA